MTVSYYKKAFKQLRAKPTKLAKFVKHSGPKERSCGRALNRCKITGRIGGHVGQYGIGVCRQSFREIAKKIGFKKYN
ncbi:MAG TPA: 30S ribosomal protein S14 [Acidobacteriota bacterium]|nr:30S ribosomal protein S14 [Acidobacteriota bacterium]